MEKKDLNEILSRMKSGDSVQNIMQPSFRSTDFTPKKKPTLKVRFKKLVTNTINSIKKSKFLMKIKTWFNKTIAQPIKDKRTKRAHDKYVKELKENFSKKFNVNVDKTINIMNGPGYSPPNIDNNKLLIENRLEINKRKSSYTFAPFMYNPEFVDIHNENINLENPNIRQIMSDETDKAKDDLDKQGEFFSKRPNLTYAYRDKKTTSRR
jgi:hypothetical protein